MFGNSHISCKPFLIDSQAEVEAQGMRQTGGTVAGAPGLEAQDHIDISILIWCTVYGRMNMAYSRVHGIWYSVYGTWYKSIWYVEYGV